MTMMDRIQNMDIDELTLFISNVSEGILDEEVNMSCCSGKSFAEICNGDVKYDKKEYIKDYLMSLTDF